MSRRVVVACALACSMIAMGAGADWMRFRGPDGSGVSNASGVPATWSADENIVWKAALPGFGSSSPVVLGDRIFLTCYTGYGFDKQAPGDQEDLLLHVLAIDRNSGKILWDRRVRSRVPETPYDGGRVELHGYASATPVTDGEALYIFFGQSGVMKYSLEGERLWATSVGIELDGHKWGSGASPILHENLVIVNASVESQSIRALDKTTGKEVWRVDEIIDSWSTPLVVTTQEGGRELVVIERFRVLGIDPASGKTLWFCPKESDYVCPSVIAHEGIVFVINSRRNAMVFAIRTGGRGDVSNSHIEWTHKWTTRVSTPVYHEGYLYGMDHLGEAHCINAETGEEVYRQRLDIEGSGDKIYASLVAVDGKLFGVTRLDGTVVLALAPEFKELARNHLGDESVFNATPTVTDGRLLLRSDKFLYLIGK